MGREILAIHGYVSLEVTRLDGTPVRAGGVNRVVDGGRQLVAQLLSGQAQRPTFSIVAGISDAETRPDLTKLFDPDGIEPVVVTDIRVKDGTITLKAAFPPADRPRLIKEVGLLLHCDFGEKATTALYNRALVRPAQTVRVKETLTMTWQLSLAPQGA